MKKEVAQLKQETLELRNQNQALVSSSIMSISKSHEVHSSMEKILKFLASVYSPEFIRQQLESQQNQSNTITQMFQTATQHSAYTQGQTHAHNNSNVTALNDDAPLFGMSQSLVPLAIESVPSNDVEMSIEGDGNDRFISADSTPTLNAPPRATTPTKTATATTTTTAATTTSQRRPRTLAQPQLSTSSSASESNGIDGDKTRKASVATSTGANTKKYTKQKSTTASGTNASSLTADRNNQLVLAYSHPHLDMIRQTQMQLQQQQLEIDRQKRELQRTMQQTAAKQSTANTPANTATMGTLYAQQDNGLHKLSHTIDNIHAKADTLNRHSAADLAAVNSISSVNSGTNAPATDAVMYSVSSPTEDTANTLGQRQSSGADIDRRSSTMSMGITEQVDSVNDLAAGSNQTGSRDRSTSPLPSAVGGNTAGTRTSSAQWNTTNNTGLTNAPLTAQQQMQQQMQTQYLMNMQQQRQLQQLKAQQQAQQEQNRQAMAQQQALQQQALDQQQKGEQQQLHLLHQTQLQNQQPQNVQQQQQQQQQQTSQSSSRVPTNTGMYGTILLPQNEQQALEQAQQFYTGMQPSGVIPPALDGASLAQMGTGEKDGDFLYSPLPPLMSDGVTTADPLLGPLDGNDTMDGNFNIDEYENMFDMASGLDLPGMSDLSGAIAQPQPTLTSNANPNTTLMNNTSLIPYAGNDVILGTSPTNTTTSITNTALPTDALTRQSTSNALDARTLSIPSLHTPLSPTPGAGLAIPNGQVSGDGAIQNNAARTRSASVKSPRLSVQSIRSPTAVALEMEAENKSGEDEDLVGLAHQRKRKRGVQ